MSRINIRGLDFDNLTVAETLELLTARLEAGEQTALFTPNSEIVQACVDDPSLFSIIGSSHSVKISPQKQFEGNFSEKFPPVNIDFPTLRIPPRFLTQPSPSL